MTAQSWCVVRFAGEEVLENIQKCVDEALALILKRRLGVVIEEDTDIKGEKEGGE